jgi:hypothetical protein
MNGKKSLRTHASTGVGGAPGIDRSVSFGKNTNDKMASLLRDFSTMYHRKDVKGGWDKKFDDSYTLATRRLDALQNAGHALCVTDDDIIQIKRTLQSGMLACIALKKVCESVLQCNKDGEMSKLLLDVQAQTDRLKADPTAQLLWRSGQHMPMFLRELLAQCKLAFECKTSERGPNMKAVQVALGLRHFKFSASRQTLHFLSILISFSTVCDQA